MARLRILLAGCFTLVLASVTSGQPAPPAFAHLVLSLSWSPEFCSQPADAAANPRECNSAKPMQFVVRGFWPEAAEGRNPESCGPAKKVSKGLVNDLLPWIPNPNTIQSLWATQGTCSGFAVGDYFTMLMRARSLVQVPVEISSIDQTTTEGVEQVRAQFAGANPSFPPEAFQVACRNGALTEVRVCLDRQLGGTACAARVASCDAPAVTIRPRR